MSQPAMDATRSRWSMLFSFVLLFSFALTMSCAFAQSTPTITEFPNIPGNPVAITSGPDAALWFAGKQIGRISTSGVVTTPGTGTGTCIPIIGCSGGGPAPNVQANGIVTGPDGALWFTNVYGSMNTIGRMTTAGALTQFSVPVAGTSGYANQIATGADGALWFTVGSVAAANPQTAVWRVTTSGTFTSYPTSGTPFGIMVGPDQSIWFTESTYNPASAATTSVGSWLGRIDRNTGVLTEFPISAPLGAFGIALGPGGQMWIGAVNSVIQATINGPVASYPVSQGNAYWMNYGPDGAFWFDSPTTSSLGRITLAGVIASYPIPTPNSGPGAIITGLDGAIWFVETNTDKIGRLALTTTTPPSQLQITTFSPLPAGGVGTSYSQALTATGGTPPYTWTLTSGTLPTGLMLSTGGVVTGTPTTVATQTFTTQVTDANSSSATASFTLSINAVACTYTFTNMAENGPPGPFTIGPSAGGGSITVLTGAGCPWSVSGAPSWVTSGSTPPVQLGGVTATGNGIVYFSILPNYGPNSRSGTLTIAGTTFPITQQAGLIPSSGFMPHLAAEGGWLTTFTLVNKGSFAADTQLSLTDDNGNPLAVPLAFPQQPSVSPVTEASLDQTIAPNASLIVQASGPANIPYVEGSAQMTSAGAVDGFAIFRYNPSGQEAVVPLGGSGTLIPFDNTNGVLTGIAIENPVSFQAITVPVILRDDTGTQIGTGMETVQLGANGHTSFVLSTQFPVTANIRGTIQFPQFEYCITVTGSCTGAVGFGFPTVLGIRYTPPGTLTTLAPLNFGPGLLPHIAAGNGWQTTFVLVNGPNVGTSYAQADLNFFDNNGNPLPVPLTVLETGASTTTASLSLSIPPNASRWIQTTASAASALLTGSAQLSAGVSGFAIYRYNPNGQEAVVPLETRNAATYLIPFDNTNGTNTGIALSLSAPVPFGGAAAPIGVPVLVRDDSGNQVAAATIPVAANGHISQVLTTLFPTTANIRGTVEFDTPPGAAISVLGIRSPPALTFTTLPALAR